MKILVAILASLAILQGAKSADSNFSDKTAQMHRDFDDICKLDKAKGLDIGESYVNDKGAAVLVSNIAHVTLQSVVIFLVKKVRGKPKREINRQVSEVIRMFLMVYIAREIGLKHGQRGFQHPSLSQQKRGRESREEEERRESGRERETRASERGERERARERREEARRERSSERRDKEEKRQRGEKS
ncbi:hypothetical protein DPMN_175348 [Dreissena polymorpha]|uniref:Uncharacterized protein n=1 Tax=Dreissena polymorpha TaxID=45954 RepID=A0A9D4E6E3_DREPO|nr:hypothetical protein DPMN_175348 [Dreissena polymorpha]